MGQVISHCAKLNGVRTNDLAYRLTQHGWKMGERRMEQLLSKHNIAEPQQLSRRRLLVKLLGIPPILMGLPSCQARQCLQNQHLQPLRMAPSLTAK
jgi:hypothetical protein